MIPLPPPHCNAALWAHVYHPSRLKVIAKCKTVTGTIVSVRSEPDGDYHIRLKLDPQYESLLDAGNRLKQHGDLVVEPVCEHPVRQKDAVAACSGFHDAIPKPRVGEHVEVTGSYVFDSKHGWNEIHPATEIVPEP